ncbi:MAG: LysM peptidoglycan-binding domain-containing M23 family metallopeptidase, partial [Chloroflexota bacterium]
AQTATPGGASPSLPLDLTAAPAETAFPPVVIPTHQPLTNVPVPTSTPPPAGAFVEPTYTATFDTAPILYYAQSGDSLLAIAKRFNVTEDEITTTGSIPETGLIDPGTLLIIPDRISEPTTPYIEIMPDNEIIFSATSVDFNVEEFIVNAGGRLSTFREYLGSTGWVDGHEAISRLAIENSINPRVLLGILEYESRWVTGEPVDIMHTDYPMGYQDYHYKGMFIQLVWGINQLSNAYYGWRAGTLTHLEFPDGTSLRLDPRLNAGTVAIQYLFSRLHSQSQWAQIINPDTGFPTMYSLMFGDPWSRADLVNPIFPPGLVQPEMAFPFDRNVRWSYTGGPHGAWEHEGALAAVDFAPATEHGGCEETPTWILSASAGLVVRSERGVVVVDMDNDGYEQTGWSLLYLHVATKDRVKVGTWLEIGDRIGHASCEGGVSTGTHLHFARKYNGEWIAADGAMPFVLSGWRAVNGAKPYEGKLVRGDETIIADPVGQKWSNIVKDPEE